MNGWNSHIYSIEYDKIQLDSHTLLFFWTRKLNLIDMFMHGCLDLAILIKTGIDNPRRKSAILESSAKPSLGCQFGLVWFGRRFKNH